MSNRKKRGYGWVFELIELIGELIILPFRLFFALFKFFD